jgi:hypothetical protein
MKHGPELAFIPHADPKKIAWSQKRLIDPAAPADVESDDEEGASTLKGSEGQTKQQSNND